MADEMDRCPHKRGHDSTPFPVHFNGNGLQDSQPDETVEDTYFRLIIESPLFDGWDSTEREMFLLELAQNCISWVQDRNNY